MLPMLLPGGAPVSSAVVRHLYLDIDGVLNPWHIDGTWGQVVEKTIFTHFPPSLIAELNELIASVPGLQVFWLSSWERASQDYGQDAGLIGSEQWPWLPAGGSGREEAWEKFVSIQEHLKVTQPDQVVWCDDELMEERAAWRWACDQPNLLPISPENVLLPEHLEQIRSFFAVGR